MNPTLIGSIAVFIWGASVSLARLVTENFGIFRSLGATFLGTALLTFLFFSKQGKLPKREVFYNPFLYLRWGCFTLHEISFLSAIFLVERKFVPLILLINYLWPTLLIIFSTIFTEVKITRIWAFALGTILVLASLSYEILGPTAINLSIFDNPRNCLAYGFALIGAILWAGYGLFSKLAGDKSGGSSVLPYFQFTLSLALPISFLPQVSTSSPSPSDIGYLYLALYCGAKFIAYLCWDYGLRKGNVVKLSLLADFIPWLSLLYLAIFLKLNLETSTIITAILLVIGAIIARWGTQQPAKTK